MTLTTDFREHAARRYERRARKWARPGDMARTLDPGTRDSPALRLIDRELALLADHKVDADSLAIFCPPQEGKSQRVARRYPEWLLAHDPSLCIAIVSYEKELATRWGLQILRDISHAGDALPISVMPDSSAAGRWDTPEEGGLYCVGVGGALTGRPVHVLVIDDPHKGREEAESPVYRERAWDWWENVAIERMAPGGIVVFIATRWHTDDLAARVLSRPGPRRWRVLTMPAIAGDRDVLGRAPGEEFPSIRGREPGYFASLQATMSSYVFASVYQQNPVAAAGNFFRRQSFRYWRPGDGLDPARLAARGDLRGVDRLRGPAGRPARLLAVRHRRRRRVHEDQRGLDGRVGVGDRPGRRADPAGPGPGPRRDGRPLRDGPPAAHQMAVRRAVRAPRMVDQDADHRRASRRHPRRGGRHRQGQGHPGQSPPPPGSTPGKSGGPPTRSPRGSRPSGSRSCSRSTRPSTTTRLTRSPPPRGSRPLTGSRRRRRSSPGRRPGSRRSPSGSSRPTRPPPATGTTNPTSCGCPWAEHPPA